MHTTRQCPAWDFQGRPNIDLVSPLPQADVCTAAATASPGASSPSLAEATADPVMDTAQPFADELPMPPPTPVNLEEATLAAVPMVDLTMIERGTVNSASGHEDKRVLLDSGSSHCFVTPRLARNLQPLDGRCKVTLADGSRQCVAERFSLQIDLNGPMTVDVLAVSLPDGIDVILGQSWMNPNQGQIHYSDDQDFFYFIHPATRQRVQLCVPAIDAHDVYNQTSPDAQLDFCSANSIRQGDELYLVYPAANSWAACHVCDICCSASW